MSFLIFSLLILVLLIFIIIVGSLEQFAVHIIAKKKIEFTTIFLPALLSIVSFVFIYFLTYLILKMLDINAFDFLLAAFMKWNYDSINVYYSIIAFLLSTIIFIILQALCIKLINIDYSKIYNKVCDRFKSKSNETLALNGETIQQSSVSIDLVKYSKYDKISFSNASIVSLFSFSTLFFLIILLVFLGKCIGERFV